MAELARAYRAQPSLAAKTAVSRYAATHKDSSGALAYLVLGTREMEDREFAQASRHLDAMAQRLPALADYTAYLGAVTRFELGNNAEVDRELKPVWEQTPSSPLVEKGVILLANAWLREGQPKKVITLVGQRRDSLTIPEAESLLGHAYQAAGDAPASLAHFQRILTDYPLSSESADAGSDPARIDSLSPQAHLARCVKLLDGGGYERARQELERLAPRLSGAARESAEVKLGVAQFLGKDNQGAYRFLEALQLSAPEADAERLYYLIRCARRLDRPSDFKKPLERLALFYPASSWRLLALQGAGDYFWVLNDTGSYQPIYRACAEAFPRDPAASECQWRYAFSEYRSHRPLAADLFEGMLQRFPASDKTTSALYFLGRIAESKNDRSAARAWYEELAGWFPNSFYAILAREKLKEAAVAGATASPATLAFLKSVRLPSRRANWTFVASPVNRARNERARLLASAGLDDLAESELRFGARQDGQPEVAALELAALASSRDAPDVAIRSIKQLAPNYLHLQIESATEKFWKLAFPLPFRGSLEQYSRERQLDPFLVAALIRQESEFNPKVISRARAYGLTQVLPSTGREISRKLSLPKFRAEMLFTPDVNLNIGTFFLRSLLDRLQGRWEATLASYNAGPGRVAKWLAWGDFAEPAEFIETIPYTETRDYVTSVLRNADLYRRLYGPKTVALASSDGDIGRKNAGPAVKD